MRLNQHMIPDSVPVNIDSNLLESGNVYLEGEISSENTLLLSRQFHFICSETDCGEINLFINSSGGSFGYGMLIYDIIQGTPVPVNTVCLGKACSIAAVLAASGTGTRYILPHSKMMLHNPSLSRSYRNLLPEDRILEYLNNSKNKIYGILSLHTGNSISIIREALSYDHYFTASEAVEFGLADEITEIGRIWQNNTLK